MSSTATASLAPAGFIGLGRMGYGMVKNLLAAGVAVSVYDVDTQAVARAMDLGASRAASPAALAAEMDTLFLCVPAGAEVRSVLFGDDGISGGAKSGLLVVDHTTYNRNEALEVAAKAAAAGIRYADCPISGMPFRALNGTLTIMFGGSETDYAAVRPYLDITGEFVVYCGAIGSGQLMKAFNNIIYNVNIAALCEVLPLAMKAGLDNEVLARVVTSGSSRSFASEYFVPRILDGEFREDFAMGSAYKDIVNVQETATRFAAMTPVVNAMIGVYQQAMARGFGEQPKSAMIKLYEQALGVEFRRNSG
jgi:3-hydroxyisobutyrate dehydrogenase-like beta-hydroxyacid dehydrogenase